MAHLQKMQNGLAKVCAIPAKHILERQDFPQMKLLVASAVSAMAILSASAASAADFQLGGVYLRLDTGASFSDKGDKDVNQDFGNSGIVGGGIGYRISNHLRMDFTLGYRGWYGADYNVFGNGVAGNISADISSFDGLANLYYDIGKFGRFTPYVGGGFGFAENTVSNMKVSANGVQGAVGDNSETDLAWQVSLGTAIDVAPRLALDVGYRYFSAGALSTGGTGSVAGYGFTVPRLKSDLGANELQIGLRYSF